MVSAGQEVGVLFCAGGVYERKTHFWLGYLCSQQWPPGCCTKLSQTCSRALLCIPRDVLVMEKKAKAEEKTL